MYGSEVHIPVEDVSCLPIDSLTLPDWMSTLDGKGLQFYTQVSDASVSSFSSGFQQHLLHGGCV